MQDASVEMVRVEVVARIPKVHRRLGRADPPLTRLRLGARGEVPAWMLETYPLALRRLDPQPGSENPRLELAEVTTGNAGTVEAAIDSSVAPKPAPKPIRPPRKRKAASPKAPTRRRRASKE